MQQFVTYLLQSGQLTQHQIDLITSKSGELELSKGEHYWEAGKMVRQIGFLTEGVIRVYYHNNKEEEITRYFIDENHLILAGHEIDENYTPSEYLQAATDCKLTVFSKKDWQEIHNAIVGWDSMIQKIVSKMQREKIERKSELVAKDASERYLDFIEKFPSIINRVPLAYIASYLGITQSSLSRIRKNIR